MLLNPISFLKSSGASTFLALTYSTDAINPQEYSGNAVLPITDAMLPLSTRQQMPAKGAIRVYSDSAKTTELPIEHVLVNEPWVTLAPNMQPNYRNYIWPAAYRDASSGKTVYAFLSGYSRLMSISRTDDDPRWSDEQFVGFANFDSDVRGTVSGGASSRAFDAHNNPAVICDAAGLWHYAGGCHLDAMGLWTSTDGSSWTEQTPIDRPCTYPSWSRVGNDLWLMWRDGQYETPNNHTSLYGALQSESATFQTPIQLDNLGSGGPTHPLGDNGTRTYPIWSQINGNDIHMMLGYHIDGTSGNDLRSHLFYLILECTLDGSGHVSSWRWKDIEGTYLAAAETPVTWANVNTPECMLVGFSTDTNALINHTTIGDAAFIATQQELTFALDPDGHPHMVIGVAKDAQTDKDDIGDYDVYYARWTGSAWSASLVYTSESTSAVFPTYVRANSDSDVTVVATRVESGWTTWQDMALVRLDWNGSTWSETDITPAGAIDATWGDQGGGTPYGMHLLSPVTVWNPQDVAFLVPQDNGSYGGVDIYGGSMPVWQMASNGDLVGDSRMLAYVLAPISATGDTTIYVELKPGTARPESTATYGAHAVWADYDEVYHLGAQKHVSVFSVAPNNQCVNSAATTNSFAFIGYSGPPATISTGAFLEARRHNGLPGVYAAINASGVVDPDIDMPPTWHSLYGDGESRRSDGISVARTTPSAGCVLFVAGSLPDTLGSFNQGVRLAWNDESATNPRLLSLLKPGAGDTVDCQGVVVASSGAAVPTINVSGLTALHATASVISATQITLAADGQQASPSSLSGTVAYANLDKPRIQRDLRSNGDQSFNGHCAEIRIAVGQTAANWTGGRIEIETGALASAYDADFVTVSTV